MPDWLHTPGGRVLALVSLCFAGAVVYLLVRYRAYERRRAFAADAWPARCTIEQRRAYVRERVAHWWVQANRAHSVAIDDLPDVEFSPRLKHALGWADSGRNLIKISDWHLMDKGRRVADETVAHEVAHIFADRHHKQACRHGPKWKAVMIKLGQSPDVYFVDTPQDEAEAEGARAGAA